MNYEKLSKEISYALRHAPWEYELELDAEGFVPIKQLICAINEGETYDRAITVDDLIYIIEHSDKKRHEICGEKIRALYGHSLSKRISKEKIEPPDILFHGTTHSAVSSILSDGLKPMSRQYVHLSQEESTAFEVGKRRDKSPVILKIDAKTAFSDGMEFFEGNDKVILSLFIPPKYISVK